MRDSTSSPGLGVVGRSFLDLTFSFSPFGKVSKPKRGREAGRGEKKNQEGEDRGKRKKK